MTFQPNGCGGKGSLINPPEMRFRQPCNEHDQAYAMGGTSKERKEADKAFLRDMLKKSKAAPWYKSAYLYPSAFVYYGAVRVFGWRYWGKS
jgi:hypothetical protein